MINACKVRIYLLKHVLQKPLGSIANLECKREFMDIARLIKIVLLAVYL